MEVKDWSPVEKDSFTTPGGPFRLPPEGEARTYEYRRAPAPRRDETVRPAPRTQEPGTAAARESSPFARGPEPVRPWYADVSEQVRADPAAAPVQAAPNVVVSHDGETQTVVPLQAQVSGGPQIYTIQLPAAPRQPAPKQRSLWWVPLVLIAALLLGLALGILAYPLLPGASEPAATQAPQNSGETAAARVYRENVDSVVSVVAVQDDDPMASAYVPASVGTGFLITEDGYLLTNAHVIQNAVQISVTLNDGREFPAQVMSTEDRISDLALLKIEAKGLHAVTLGDSASAQVGDEVFTIGNPFGELNFSLATGYISAGPRKINTGSTTLTMLQTNASFNIGNSGGPLFDEAGKVIGIVTAKLSVTDTVSGAEGLGFALPINDVMTLVDLWLEGQQIG